MKPHIVDVELNNKWAFIQDAAVEDYAQLEKYWSYTAKGAYFSPANEVYRSAYLAAVREGEPTDNLPGWDGKVRFLKRYRVAAGLFRATRRDILEKLNIKFRCHKIRPRLKVVRGLPPPKDPKYLFQVECSNKMVDAIPDGGGILLAATSTGKTATAARFFSRVTVPCLFVVDQLNLLVQAQEELSKHLGEPVGIVGDGKRVVERVTVATVQTLAPHQKDAWFKKWFRTIKITVVDELHEQMSRRNFKVLESISPVARYGLTATLQMRKKTVRFKAWAFAGPVLFEFPVAEAMDAGVVAKGSVLQLLFQEWDTGGMLIDFMTTEEKHEEEVLKNPEKIEAATLITRWGIAAGRHVLQLVDRISHFKKLRKAARKEGIKFGQASGLHGSNRKQLIEEFEQEVFKLFIATRVFTKGVSINIVDMIIDMAERPNVDNVMQKFGRGLRHHGKDKHLLYVDFGTQGDSKVAKASAKRARALKRSGIVVKTVKVAGPRQALEVFKKHLQKLQREAGKK